MCMSVCVCVSHSVWPDCNSFFLCSLITSKRDWATNYSDLYIFDVIKEILKIDTKHECTDRAQLSGSCAGGSICTHCMACRYACNDVYRHHNLSGLQETVQYTQTPRCDEWVGYRGAQREGDAVNCPTHHQDYYFLNRTCIHLIFCLVDARRPRDTFTKCHIQKLIMSPWLSATPKE